MHIDLKGKSVLITGASKGIGLVIAEHMAAEGCNLHIAARNEAQLKEAAERLTRQHGVKVATYRRDLGLASEVESLGKACEGVDILVNNAGILRDNLLFRMSDDEWDAVIAIHLKGSFLCSRAAQRYMVEQRYGKIVMTSSISALGNKGQVNYAAAKAGLQGLMRTMAIELGPFNINVNAVAPGWIETDMLVQAAQGLGTSMDVLREQFAKEIPLRRLGQPQDVANVVAFLVSDEASYINGETIYVAGGPVGVL